MSDHPYEHHRHVGLMLMGFSAVGIGLGLVMTARGFVSEGFLDGPSAIAIGAVTFLVGLSLRREGASSH